MNFEDLWNGLNDNQPVVLCEHCNGYGSSLKEEQDKCSCCGGTGLAARKPTEAENEERINQKVGEAEQEPSERRILWNRSAR